MITFETHLDGSGSFVGSSMGRSVESVACKSRQDSASISSHSNRAPVLESDGIGAEGSRPRASRSAIQSCQMPMVVLSWGLGGRAQGPRDQPYSPVTCRWWFLMLVFAWLVVGGLGIPRCSVTRHDLAATGIHSLFVYFLLLTFTLCSSPWK